MKRNRKKKMREMAIKLDMSKAYDRIEWSYLNAILKSLGFTERWISLIILCVMSVQYFVLVDGKSRETFTPTIRLRQDDTLSSYFFLYSAKGFSFLMDQANKREALKGLEITMGSTRINHLLFSNDCVLFEKASKEEWTKM